MGLTIIILIAVAIVLGPLLCRAINAAVGVAFILFVVAFLAWGVTGSLPGSLQKIFPEKKVNDFVDKSVSFSKDAWKIAREGADDVRQEVAEEAEKIEKSHVEKYIDKIDERNKRKEREHRE